MKPEVRTVRGKSFFLCNYTGAFLTRGYSFPVGKKLTKKEGIYVSLPVMLRHLHETCTPDDFEAKKRVLEVFYQQPDIPLAPVLDLERVPLSQLELDDYLMSIDMGHAWLQVPKALEIETLTTKKRRKIGD